MSFGNLHRILADEIDRTAATASRSTEEVTVELAVSPDGRLAPNPRRTSDTTPYVDIKMTLTRIDPLARLREILPKGWTLVIDGGKDHPDGANQE